MLTKHVIIAGALEKGPIHLFTSRSRHLEDLEVLANHKCAIERPVLGFLLLPGRWESVSTSTVGFINIGLQWQEGDAVNG